MADEQAQYGLLIGGETVSNGNKVRNGSISPGTGIDATTFAATKDQNAIRAALTAQSALYTSAKLNTMTRNDMVYALLLANGYKA